MDKYEIIKELGQGGFGKALLVRDKSTKRKVVVKEVAMNNLSADNKAKARAEANVLKLMQHDNIVTYVESFEEAGNMYIAMDFADGGDLSIAIDKKVHRYLSIEKDLARCVEDKVLAGDGGGTRGDVSIAFEAARANSFSEAEVMDIFLRLFAGHSIMPTRRRCCIEVSRFLVKKAPSSF
jgi:serine/threonine protein kinase